MDKETTALIMTALIKYGPEVAQGLVTIYHTEKATPADWEANVFSKCKKTYEQYTAQVAPLAQLVTN